jgi:hypothetical protein
MGAHVTGARPQRGHLGADSVDGSGDLPAADPVGPGAQAVPGQPDRIGQAAHQVPHPAVHAGRMHPDQHLVGADRRLLDLLEAQHVVGFAVLVLHDGAHTRRLLWPLSGRGS